MSTLILLIGLAALAGGYYFYRESRKADARLPESISVEEASKIIKEQAESQKVQISLSEEQMEAIRQQWIKDPSRPAQITFSVGDKNIGDIKVATCAYFGTTCCA